MLNLGYTTNESFSKIVSYVNGVSSNGRTLGFGPSSWGSSPYTPAINYLNSLKKVI